MIFILWRQQGTWSPGLGSFQVRYKQAGRWSQQSEALAQHLKEEPPCITVGGRGGGWRGAGQCQLIQSTDLVSLTGLLHRFASLLF